MNSNNNYYNIDEINHYSLLKLQAITDVVSSTAVDKVGSRKEYFKVLQDFVMTAPSIIEELRKTATRDNFELLVELIGNIQSSVLKISSPSVIWESSKLISYVNLKHQLAIEDIDALAKSVRLLCSGIQESQVSENEAKQEEEDAKNKSDNLSEDIDSLKELPPNNAKKTIIAVDDMPDILKTLKVGLQKSYNVIGIVNQLDAIKCLSTYKVDLILLDIEMPDMDGFTLLDIIRKLSGYDETPIIFLTGNSSAEYVKQAMSRGANDFITKPIDLNVISDKISKYL